MIPIAEMLKIFQQYRRDAIVVPGRGGPHWVHISTKPNLDLSFGDPAMGGHASFSFGLAMAQPERKVVLFDSEGDLLMNTGVLATIAEHQPKNFYHFLLDNECYAITGGQPVPNAKNISYDVIARGYGYPRAYAYTDLAGFALNIERILAEPGPVFVALKVVAEVLNAPIGQRKPWMTRNRAQIIKDVKEGLGIAV